MYTCSFLPKPFSSGVSRKKIAKISLPDDISRIEKVQLKLKNWGQHSGSNQNPFQLNGHPYSLFLNEKWRILAFSSMDVSLDHLKPGENEILVFSDTQHHGLEIFLPGPVLLVRYRK